MDLALKLLWKSKEVFNKKLILTLKNGLDNKLKFKLLN